MIDPKPGQCSKRHFECAGPVGSPMKRVLGDPTFELQANLIQMPGLASQPIGPRQNNQVLVPVQFPDGFVIARARRVQVGDAAKVGKAGFNAARIVATPADFRPRVERSFRELEMVVAGSGRRGRSVAARSRSPQGRGHRQMGWKRASKPHTGGSSRENDVQQLLPGSSYQFQTSMCGIAGYFLRSRNADLSQIQAMCEEIRHRGPDDEGYRIDGRMGMGMRRLSIIDLATGRQPISNEDGTVWVVSNGEIYNYRELRTSLIRSGHRFRTHSDTEVLVHLYEEQGVDGLRRLRGMFACAIWDSRERSLLLVRDRFGKKPLYYAALPEGLYFGSELKCLRAAGVPLEHDREALQLYFLLGYVPDPWTPYLSIHKLSPGGWLRCNADGHIQQGRYWTLPVPAERPPGGSERIGSL